VIGVIRWERPPRANTDWPALIAELQERPGEWARVLDPTNEGRANHYYRTLRAKGAEAVARKVDGQGVGVWARWPVGGSLT
jgi:hypothetical protein